MNLNIANSCIETIPFAKEQNISLKLKTLLPNVQVRSISFMDSAPNTATEQDVLTDITNGLSFLPIEAGNMKIISELLTIKVSGNIIHGNTSYFLLIGKHDGTGEDFFNVFHPGAKVRITFLDETVSEDIVSYPNPTSLFDYYPLNSAQIDLSLPMFQSNADGKKAIQFDIEQNTRGQDLFEASIWIHIFDGQGNLKGIVKKSQDDQDGAIENKSFKMNLDQGFSFLPLIRGRASANSTPSTGDYEFEFDIGDPKKDADVQVEEV